MIINLESNYKYLRVDFEKVFKSIADLDTTNVITTDIVNNIIVEGMVPNDDVFDILKDWGFEKANDGLNRFKLDVISLPIKQFINQLGDLSLLGNLYNTNTIDDLDNLKKAIPSANKNIDIPPNLVGNFKYLRVDYEELFKTVAEYLDCTADDVLKILKNEVSDDLLLKIREKITDADLDKAAVVNKIILQIIQLPIRQLPGYLGDIALLGNFYNSTTQTSIISAIPDIKREVITVISFTMSNTALKLNDTSTVTVVFSEAVEEFSNADITVVNGSLDTMTTTDNITWTGIYTPTINVQENINVLILGTDWTDAAGNAYTGNAITTANFTIDTRVVTVISFTMSNTALKLNDTSTVTVVFSEAVEEFSNADITVVNGSLDTMTTTDNITWTGIYTPTINVQENINVLILGTDWTDAAGNAYTGNAITTANFTIDTRNSFNLLPDAEEGAVIIKLNEPLILTNNGESEVEVNLNFDEDTKNVVYQLEAKEDDGQYISYEKYIDKWRKRDWVLYTQLMNDGSPDRFTAKNYQHTKQRIMFEGITDNGEGLSVFKESCLNVDLEQIPNKNPFGGGWVITDLLDLSRNTHGYGQLDDELYIKSNGVIFKREEKRLFLPPYQTSIWVMLYYKIYNNGDVDDTTPKITVQVDLSYHQHVAYMKRGEVDWWGFKKNGLSKQNNVWGRQPNFYTENPDDFFSDPDPQAQYNDHGLGIEGIEENKGYIETAIKLLISTEDELKAWYDNFATPDWNTPSAANFGKAEYEHWERRFVRDPMGAGYGEVAEKAIENISQSITFGPYIKTKENGEKDIRIFGPSGCSISANGEEAAHGQPGFEGSKFPKMIEFDLDIEKINEKNVSNGGTEGLINIWQDISGSGLGVVQLDGDIGEDGDETSSHSNIAGIDNMDARVIAFDVPNNRYVFNKNVIEFIPIDNSDKYTIKYSPQKEYLSDSLDGGIFTVDSSVVKLELFTNVNDEDIEDSVFENILTNGAQLSVKPLFKDDGADAENVGYTTTLLFDPRLKDGKIMGKLDTSVFSEFSELMGKTAEENQEKQLLPLETIDKDDFDDTEWISTENTNAEQRLNRYKQMVYNDAEEQVYHGTTTTN